MVGVMEREVTAASADALDLAFSRAARGDQAAFAEVYDLTQARLHGVVLSVVRNAAIAEEVTQEVYVEVWRQAPRFDPSRGSVMSWASTIARRRAVDRVRSEQARTNREDRQLPPMAPPDDHLADDAAERLDNARVHEALATLSDGQRDAVTLAYFSGYSYRQVADVLDLPEGTVKTRIRSGLRKLRDHLGAMP